MGMKEIAGRIGEANKASAAVLAKRVLLFLDIQKQLDITLPPEKLYDVQTIEELTNLAFPLLEEKKVMA